MKVLGFKKHSHSYGSEVRYDEVLVAMTVDELSLITRGAGVLETNGLSQAPKPESTFEVHAAWRYMGDIRSQSQTLENARRILLGLAEVLQHVPEVQEPQPTPSAT